MIAVGLLSHGSHPEVVPDLAGIGKLHIGVNAEGPPSPTAWLGFGANHNRLIESAGACEWYVALNADVTVSGRQIQRLVEGAERQGFSLVGPLRREPWGPSGGVTQALPAPGRLARGSVVPDRIVDRVGKRTSSGGSFTEAPWVSGSCMAIRRDVLERLRFDQRYFMYFEDVDLSRRARLLGARVGICTSVTVNHAVGWSPSDPLLSERGVEYARSALVYAQVWGHAPPLMRLAALAHAGVRSVFPRRSPAAVAANRALLKGFLAPGRRGLRELAAAHNERFGFVDAESRLVALGEA